MGGREEPPRTERKLAREGSSEDLELFSSTCWLSAPAHSSRPDSIPAFSWFKPRNPLLKLEAERRSSARLRCSLPLRYGGAVVYGREGEGATRDRAEAEGASCRISDMVMQVAESRHASETVAMLLDAEIRAEI